MNEVNIGNVLSVIANLGVIAGIVFLAFELRQNSEWLASESRYNHTAARVTYRQMLASDDVLADVMAKARRRETLSDSECLRQWNFPLMHETWLEVEGSFEPDFREFIDLEILP